MGVGVMTMTKRTRGPGRILMASLMLAIGIACGALLLGSVYGQQTQPVLQEVRISPAEHAHEGMDNGETVAPRDDGIDEASTVLPSPFTGELPERGGKPEVPAKVTTGQNKASAVMPSPSTGETPEKGEKPEDPVKVTTEQNNMKAKRSEPDQASSRSNHPSNTNQVSLSAAAGSLADAANDDPAQDPIFQNPVSKFLGSQTPRNRQGDLDKEAVVELPSRKPIDPSKVLDSPLAGSPGGCLKAYGENGQCLPTVPPSEAVHVRDMIASGQDAASMQHPWTCEELQTIFADGIKVRVSGQDPQKLDRNDDGVACGLGD